MTSTHTITPDNISTKYKTNATLTKDDDEERLVEEYASNVVTCIRRCIEILRREFVITTPSSTAKCSSTSTTKATTNEFIPLYIRMVDHGILNEINNIANEWKTKIVYTQLVQRLNKNKMMSEQIIDMDILMIIDKQQQQQQHNQHYHLQQQPQQQRYRLVHDILLPLWLAMVRCYTILDQLSTKPKTTTTTTTTTSKSLLEQQQQQQENKQLTLLERIQYNKKNKKQLNNKPIPPKGMLSIQDYTDIACLLEFTICISILPLLNSFVGTSIYDRVRYLLPKSMAGRIPRQCLLWGTTSSSCSNAVPATNTTTAAAATTTTTTTTTTTSSSSCSSTNNTVTSSRSIHKNESTILSKPQKQKQKQNQNKQQQEYFILELRQTMCLVSSLIFLDRFRPMLLPRHLADIYATTFQVERYRQQQQQQSNKNYNTNDNNTSNKNNDMKAHVEEEKQQDENDNYTTSGTIEIVGISSTISNNCTTNDTNDRKQQKLSLLQSLKHQEEILHNQLGLASLSTTTTTTTTTTAVAVAAATQQQNNDYNDDNHNNTNGFLMKTTNSSNIKDIPNIVIDPYLQAKAYQSLLIHGMKSPKWLRNRISKLLTILATIDLGAVIQVFVPIGNKQIDMSAASQRLGHTLLTTKTITTTAVATTTTTATDKKTNATTVSSPSKTIISSSAFWYQLLSVLDEACPILIPTSSSSSSTTTNDLSNSRSSHGKGDEVLLYQHHPRQLAIIQTVWSVLNQLSPIILHQKILLPYISRRLLANTRTTVTTATNKTINTSIEGNSNDDDVVTTTIVATTTSIHQMSRELGALFSFVPSSINPAKVCRSLIFAPLKETKKHNDENKQIVPPQQQQQQLGAIVGTIPTVLGELIRLASMSCVLESTTKQDSIQTLRWIINTVTTANSNKVLSFQLYRKQKQKNNDDKNTRKSSNVLSSSQTEKDHKKIQKITSSDGDVKVNDGYTILAIALMYAIAPSQWDLEGYQYRIASSSSSLQQQEQQQDQQQQHANNGNISTTTKETTINHQQKQNLESVSLIQQVRDNDNTNLVGDIKKRALILIEVILGCGRSDTGKSNKSNDGGSSIQVSNGDDVGKKQNDGSDGCNGNLITQTTRGALVHRLFQLILGTYLATLTATSTSSNAFISIDIVQSLLPTYMRQQIQGFKLVSMVLLPMLCEKCSPEELLLGTVSANKDSGDIGGGSISDQSNNGTGVLDMVKLVLQCCANMYQLTEKRIRSDGEAHSVKEDHLPIGSYNDDSSASKLRQTHDDGIPTLFSDDSMRNLNLLFEEILNRDNNINDKTNANPKWKEEEKDDVGMDPNMLLQPQQKENITRTGVEETVGSDSNDENHEDKEALLSISSIVLSLLIAVLELGAKRRSKKEEELLNSFHSILRPLAQVSERASYDGPFGRTDSETSPSFVSQDAAMADMAGYAMALIASRGAQEIDQNDTSVDSMRSSFDDGNNVLGKTIVQAEQDLKSTQPPIRARGMVSLGRLARGYLMPKATSKQSRDRPLVQVIEDQTSSSTEDMEREGIVSLLVQEILRLSTIALTDSESYVYLAAVQTAVAAGDLRPREVLPVVARAVATGTLCVTHESSKIGKYIFPEKPRTTLTLVNEQRIKLAEALIFMIRRRAATDEFIPTLVHIMAYGCSERIAQRHQFKNEFSEEGDDQRKIQGETHDYFMSGRHRAEEDEEHPQIHASNYDHDSLQDEEDKHREKDIRLRTGGPVFLTEEADLVRSTRISVLAELVAASKPRTLVPYCALLVGIAIDVLRLETTRVVCRAASLLARELYGLLLREGQEIEEGMLNIRNSPPTASIPWAVEMVASGEESLFNASKQQQTHDSNDKRVYDPATASRCREAIRLRELADEGGIISAARLMSLQEQDHPNRLLKFLDLDKSPPIKVDEWASLG